MPRRRTGYDSVGKLTGLVYKQGGTNLFTPYSWTFDSASRITQFVSADGTSNYSYDKTSQLTAADHNYQSDESYSYDANGNRDSTGYTTGSDNRMTADGTYTYTYDDEGNRTSRTHNTTDYETLYEWDYRNRLTKVTERNDATSVLKVVQYTYDLFDRRIGKAVDTTSPFNLADAAIERYVYDDLNGVSSVDGGNIVLDFVDPDGSGSTAIALEARQLYANRVDQILAKEDVTVSLSGADRVQWPLVDNLGTVRDLVENDGVLGEHYEYDSFGQVISGDTSVIRYLYTSREHDPDTGLQYNRARWYDAAVGRWISQDPIGFAAGDANLVRYVRNGATTAIDPSGLAERVIEVVTFIPYGHVKMAGGLIELEGDDRFVNQAPNGSFRMRSKIVVELDPSISINPVVHRQGEVGESAIRYHFLPGTLRALEGEYRDYGTQMLEAEGKRDGKNTIVEVSQSGTVPKSFVITALAPSIDYSLKFTFDPNGRVNVSGSHDGFPAYEVYMDKVLLYSHNARQTNEGVMSLFPPMEHDIDEDCDGRRQPPPWYKLLLPYPFNRGFRF